MIIRVNDNGTLKTFNILDESIIAEDFDSTTVYAVGEYVFNGNTLYRFTSAHSAGAWNSSEVTAVAVCDELTSLKSDLQDKIDKPSTAGTNGQVLTSDGQGGQSWQTPQSGGGVSPYTSNPEALGTASAGSSDDYARGDHVHPMPTAANVGAIASPSSPSSGDFLVYNGSAWVAQSLSTWQGGSY